MNNLVETVQTLRANLGNLTGRDREFADSLLGQFQDRGRLSEKQWPWLAKLATRATQAPREAVAVNLARVIALLDTAAASGLKRPRIVLRINDSLSVALKIAGPQARVPGSVNVVAKVPYSEFERPTWYGRITRAGMFEPSQADAPAELVPALIALAADPASAAAAQGHMTGACCFCRITLTDARSVAVGYGPTCAENYGLPWGAVPIAEPAERVACEPMPGDAPIPRAGERDIFGLLPL